MVAKKKDDKVKDDYFEMIEGSVPKGYKADFEESLFNSETHRKLQSDKGWHSFHLLRKDKKKVLGSIHFCVSNTEAVSPKRAPFGSFELSPLITTSQLYELIGFFEKKLKKKGVNRVQIKSYPAYYNINSHNILTVLLSNHQYNIINAELGACIRIGDGNFEDRIDGWEKRKLKQSIKADLRFKVIPIKGIEDTYRFISWCRKERGHQLSMTYEDLEKTVKLLKGHFVLFGVYQAEQLVAASISIRVNHKVLYNFYSAHSKSANAYSPVVFLIGEMYAWCQTHHVTLLDLGTSAWDGVPNFSLIDFKLRLGGVPAMKLTFEKELL